MSNRPYRSNFCRGILHALNQSLRLEQGAVGRKGVKGVDHETTSASVSGHKTQRRQPKSTMRMQQVQQTALAAIREQLFMDAAEDRQGKRLRLGAHLVTKHR